MTNKALQKARKEVAEAKKRYKASNSKNRDLKALVIDTSRYKNKTDAVDILMQLRYGKS